MTRTLVPLLFGLIGAAILVSLGVWQMQRLEWKETILAEIEATIQGAPVDLPDSFDPATDRYLPVRVEGRITTDEIHVLASIKRIGAVYRIIAAFETEDGRRILVDRGYVRPGEKDTPRTAGPLTIEGNLHMPDEIDGFTPDADVAANIWYARHVPSMAAHLDTEELLVVARATSQANPEVIPLPVDSGGIPNDHLQYAVTWFGLAIVWIAMTGYFLLRNRRQT